MSDKTTPTPTAAPTDMSALEALIGATPAPEAAVVEGESNPAQDTVEVRIKGRTLTLAPEDAAAIEEFRREARERDGRLGGELHKLREEHARLAGTVDALRAQPAATTDDDIKPPPPELAVEDFAEYHRRMLAYTSTMMMRQQADLRDEYQRDVQQRQSQAERAAAQQRWADAFYASNPTLAAKPLRPVVQSVYLENAEELNAITDVKAQHTRLAELAAARIVEIQGAGKTAGEKPPRFEGQGSTPAAKRPTEMGPARRVMSAADFVRAERARLRGEKVNR